MTTVHDAIKSVDRIDSLTIEGKTITRDVADGIIRAEISRDISGSSQFEITIHDSDGKLLRSPLMKEAVIAKIDERAYELVKVRKVRDEITLLFEDLAIANLRTHDTPIKVAPGTTTHVDFVKRLVGEESWLKLVVPDDVSPPRAKVELGRGTPSTEGADEEKEDSWVAIGRIGNERGWRRFIRNQNEVWYTPDKWLHDQEPIHKIRQYDQGVDEIDFDYDVGKPIATAKIIARASRWGVPVGATIEILDTGPADGKWLVQQVRRDVFSLTVEVELIQPRPELPEPEPQAPPAASDRGESGYGSPAAAVLGSLDPGGSSGSSGAPSSGGSGGSSSGGPSGGTPVSRVVSAALSQRGTRYIWGGKTTRGFDCSGLVQWATRRGGRVLPGSSYAQYLRCRNAGLIIPVARAMNTRGALLFRIGGATAGTSSSANNHVAISLGNGQVMEARGRAWGCGIFNARGRTWSHGAYIPGFSYTSQATSHAPGTFR